MSSWSFANMLATFLLVAGLACGQPAAAPPGQSPAKPTAESPAELKAAVGRLVRQLDDTQLARRESAEKELIGLGPAVIDLLPPVTRQMPAEVKERLARVRRTLESSAAELSLSPTRVTLKGPLKFSEALLAIEKQTGNRLVDYREEFNQQRREFNFEGEIRDKPFWEALDSLLDQGELTTYAFSGERAAAAIVARGEGEMARSKRGVYSGMFRFEPLRVEAVRDIVNPSNHALRLFLDIAWEPRLQPILIAQPLEALKATADNGDDLPIDGREGEIEVPVDGDSSATEMYIPLELPGRNIAKIASLRGKLDVLAPGRMETFEFPDIEKAKGVELRRAAATVTLDQVRQNQEVYEVRMRIKFQAAANALESHRDWIYQNPAVLVSPGGEKLDNVGLEATLQEEDQVGISYQFVAPDGIKGFKFRYTTPVSIVKFPVEYELKNIELP
ncbi:MAG: hypothetical protein ACKO38_05490 [Planctomycetota bacterium]